jgi:cell division protein FtsB
MALIFKGTGKHSLRLLLITGLFYGLYWYYDDTAKALAEAAQKAESLEGTNQQLELEAKGLKTQTRVQIIQRHQMDG